MKMIPFLLLSYGATLVTASLFGRARCHADNCLRAIRATGRTTWTHSAARDCSEFMSTPTYVPQSYATSNTTITVAPGTGVNSGYPSCVTPEPPTYILTSGTIPTYASACSGASRYSSACSCYGVTAGTRYYTAPPLTVYCTITVIATSPTASPTPSYSSSSSSSPPGCHAPPSSTSSLTAEPTWPTTQISSTSTSVNSSTSISWTPVSSSASASSTPSVYPNGTYAPNIPTSYEHCLYDPYNASEIIELIDQNTGIPFRNANGRAVLADDTLDNISEYHFSKPAAGPSGVFDLVTETGEYVAIFEDGHVGFVPSSSDGQEFVSGPDGSEYVTTVWSLDCDGNLSLGILGGVEYELGLDGASGKELYARSKGAPGNLRRKSWVAVRIAIFLKRLLHIRTDLGIDQQRCDNPELHAVPKFGVPAATSNGCGSFGLTWNYEPFVSCCDAHDICFGTCGSKFLDCNRNFASCLENSCDTAYPGGDIPSQIKKLGCLRLAAIFEYIVESEIGRIAFDNATKKQCDCCRQNEQSCLDGCVDVLTDPRNCGTCGNVCATGQCQNGVCSDQRCNGKSCYSFERCGASSDCVCYTTADGTGFCAGNYFCDGLPDCSSNADCGGGSICAVGSCCTRNVCLPAVCANTATNLISLARKASRKESLTSAGEGFEAQSAGFAAA